MLQILRDFIRDDTKMQEKSFPLLYSDLTQCLCGEGPLHHTNTALNQNIAIFEEQCVVNPHFTRLAQITDHVPV